MSIETKKYKLLKKYESPKGTCHVGVTKTAREWQLDWFPSLKYEDFGIKKDWFKEVLPEQSNDKGSERIKVIGFRSNDGYVPYEKQQQSWSYTLNLSKEVIGDYSEFRKKIEQALNVEDKVVRHVYNSMEFETNAGEKLFLCMRDSGYEIQYFGTTYEFKEGKCIPHIKSDKKYTQSEVDTIREDLWNRCREWADGQWSNQFFPDGKNSQFKYPTLQDYLQSLPENKIKEQDTDTKDWEIVSVEDGVANGSQGKGKIVYIQKGDESSWIKANIKINSVKRLSDGVVFSIGDYVGITKESGKSIKGWKDIIESFLIVDDTMVSVFKTFRQPINDLDKLTPTEETDKAVTNNDDVACLSLNDVMAEFGSYGNGHYESLYKKVKEKLKQ